MAKTNPKVTQRARIKRRIRAKISGTAERPRLSVFRSNRHLSVQLIDDVQGHTLASASTYEAGVADDLTSVEAGARVGKLAAERALAAGIQTVVFDRNGYRYHGRVKAVADGAREGGLQF